jgi:hypothetical protein
MNQESKCRRKRVQERNLAKGALQESLKVQNKLNKREV